MNRISTNKPPGNEALNWFYKFSIGLFVASVIITLLFVVCGAIAKIAHHFPYPYLKILVVLVMANGIFMALLILSKRWLQAAELERQPVTKD